jgi:hypothetical protein
MNIRGPRTFGCALLDGTINTVSAVTLQSLGSLSTANNNAGSFTRSYPNNGNTTVANDNYLLIGNPYPSEISFSQLRADNSGKINNNYAVFSPGNATGNYGYWNGSTWTGGTVGLNDATGNIIANGQAFFVQGSIAGADITNLAFNESQKTSTPNNGYYRTTSMPNRLRIGLLLYSGERMDETMLLCSGNTHTDKLTNEDIISISNGAQHLQSLKAGKALAFNNRPEDLAHDTIPLNISSNASGSYQLSFYDFEGLAQNGHVKIYLLDNYQRTRQLMNDQRQYAFTIDMATPSSYGAGRFLVVLDRLMDMPFTVSAIKSYPNPFNDQLIVSLPNTGTYTIRLLDIQGKELQRFKTQGQLTIPTGHLPTGSYIIEALNNKGEKSVQRVSKQ